MIAARKMEPFALTVRATDAAEFEWYSLGPADVGIRSDLPEILADFRELYGHSHLDAPAGNQRIRMTVRAAPAGRWRRTVCSIIGDGVELFTDLSAAEALPYLEWGINHRFIATHRDRVIFHAAGLARGGRGVVLVGTSGSGKSTLAAALAARGWDFLGDEFVLLDPGNLEMRAYRKALCVKSGSFELVRKLGLPLLQRGNYVKSFKGPVGFVPADRLAAPRGPVELTHVVFPNFAGGVAAVAHPVSVGRAAFLLAESTFNRNRLGESLPALLGRIATRCPCHALTTDHLDAACGFLERLVAASA